MGKHGGHQGGRRPIGDEVMTDQFYVRAAPELTEQIELRRQARGVPPETAVMIRHLIKLGIEADIRDFKLAK